MLGQDFLVESIKELIPEEDVPDALKEVLRSSLLKIRNYPAVIVESEPYDYSQETGQGAIILKKENFNLAIIVRSENTNNLDNNKYKLIKQKLTALTKLVVDKINTDKDTHEKISTVTFGRSEDFDSTISSVPVMWSLIPVEIILVSN